ncbi:hypothetical protein LV476_06145 [Guyparkeria hydrothermalis]|uniref:hypothetical protein n=1 Tax=Guyparkeria hydrothermalis TaxID=923 RepID=UPI0020217F84|nr:hypothetical protein [Guyparkeria hydrothermalis]MCL7744531.1 hypothetical protein [Guyparkeria hydrothermalis]
MNLLAQAGDFQVDGLPGPQRVLGGHGKLTAGHRKHGPVAGLGAGERDRGQTLARFQSESRTGMG